MRMANAVWWYYIAKLTELLDTVFFVLRKKNNQITFLHVYHHFMMPICGWIGVKFLPGGHGTLLGVINSFIHIWMYLYYMIASLGPQYQQYLWWKKHLTEMQMIQFCLIFIHEFQVLFRQCDYPKVISVLLTIQSAFFLNYPGSSNIQGQVEKKIAFNVGNEDEGMSDRRENIHKRLFQLKKCPSSNQATSAFQVLSWMTQASIKQGERPEYGIAAVWIFTFDRLSIHK
ncbi:hypothetical protein Trydic_g17568 [Trypoxylus dichotomus]